MPSLNRKRVFISFAVPEDTYARDFLVGQAKNSQTPFDFIDMSVKEPWSALWKDKCRTKVKGCDGFVALLSKATLAAAGARWEMECAVEEGVPVIGVHIKKDEKFVPPELNGENVIEWSWDEIARFIDSL
jgi:hypothetical protein